MSNNTPILVTHDDLDGVGCEVVFKSAYGNSATVYECNYNNVNQTLKEIIESESDINPDNKPVIIIADISVNEEVADILNQRGDVVLYDHHNTALWMADNYNWANIDTSICGTVALYRALLDICQDNDYLVKKLERLDEFVYLVDDYDRWIHSKPESLDFNTLFFLMGREKFVKRIMVNAEMKPTSNEITILEIENAKKKRYIESKYKNAIVVGAIAYVFADTYISELGHYILENNPSVLLAVIIDLTARKVSLRSEEETDCSEIAKFLGGGGHPQASGFQLSDDQVWEFATRILPTTILEI